MEGFKKYPYVKCGVKQVYPNVQPGGPLFANSVVAGNLVFVSGQTAVDPNTGICTTTTIQEQMEICMSNIKFALEEAGSSMEYMARMLIILKDMKDYHAMRLAEQNFYKKHAPSLLEDPPGSTVFSPGHMAKDEFLVEIEVTGYIPCKE